MFNHIQQRPWHLIDLHADALVIRSESEHTNRLPMDEIAGYGLSLRARNGDAGHVDVILHNGKRFLITSPRPHELVHALDTRLG